MDAPTWSATDWNISVQGDMKSVLMSLKWEKAENIEKTKFDSQGQEMKKYKRVFRCRGKVG
jgi:hypothetical protein